MLNNITQFQNYFSGSKSVFGNSELFSKIQTLVAELSEMNASNPIVSERMAKERLELINRIHEAGVKYMSERSGARTGKGKERLEAVQDLVNFCTKEYNALNDPDRVRYFRGKDIEELQHEITGRDLGKLKNQIDEYRSMPFTEENIISRAKAMDRYVVASRIYLAGNANPDPTFVKQLNEDCEAYKKFAENARDLRTVRRLVEERDKGWNDLDTIEIPEIEIQQKGEIVGAAVNQRMKLTHNGVTGFFTPEAFAGGYEENIHHLIEQEPDLEVRKILQENESILLEFEERTFDAVNEYEHEKGESVPLSDLFVQLLDKWEGEKEPTKKKLYYEMLDSKPKLGFVKSLNGIIREIENTEHFENDADKAKQILKTIEKMGKLDGIPDEMNHFFKENPERLLDLSYQSIGYHQTFGERPQKKALNFIKHYFQHQAAKLPEDSPKARALKQMSTNEHLLNSYASIVKRGKSMVTANNTINMKSKDETIKELTSRNVLSSRIAELLGVGSLMAHSEKMNVKMDGKVVQGSFMEFAQGVDPLTKNDMEQRMLAEIIVESNASLNHDIFSIEVLDFLCYQNDRHGNNMFYKLSDVHPDGKRRIVGISAIDNDLAFGEDNAFHMSQRLTQLKDLIFIDKDMADRIRKLDRDALELAAEGILSKKEMDAFEERLNMLKDHIDKNMVEIEKDDWDLNPLNAKKYGSRSHKFQEGLEVYEKSLQGKRGAWEQSQHRDYFIRGALNEGSVKANEARAEEAYILSGVKELFEEAEGLTPERKKLSEIKKEVVQESKEQREARRAFQAERAAMFDKIIAEKEIKMELSAKELSVDEKTVKETPVKTVREPEKTDYRKLSPFDKTLDRGIRFGMKPEEKKAAKPAEKKSVIQEKELDLGFTEITKEDIMEANRKPIIGGHRGPKK